ncbi:MAG: SAM-dependent methyltransferase [Clostridiaceae bacterium]|nr:SAM-dependent methyltransferase [Eubacteriales bacterium]
MDELRAALAAAFTDTTYKIVLSAALQKDAQKLTLVRKEHGFQAERRVGAQAFHENLTEEEACVRIEQLMGAAYRQYNAWDDAYEHMVRVGKDGKAFHTKSRLERAPKKETAHDREKSRFLKEGEPIGPLVEMGVFTPDGRIVKAMYDKYRQIDRFLEIVDDALSAHDPQKPLTAVDFGCGKSYLTFVLYHYFTKIKGFPRVDMTGLDLKKDVIENCNAAAKKFGYENLRFQLGDIRGYEADTPIDMVVSLHACDTATDYALSNAVGWGARYIFSVPCCQHELNAQIRTESLSLLTRYGIVKERAAALFTDAIRAGLLTACGYKTQVLEFVDLSHTPKNLLLRAQKANLPLETRRAALKEVEALMEAFRLKPTLYALLKERLP